MTQDYDVWMCVAKYVAPHPRRLTRLAQVNKTFYRIFMSDAIWSSINIYGVPDQISLHYLAATQQYTTSDVDCYEYSRQNVNEQRWGCDCNRRGNPLQCKSCHIGLTAHTKKCFRGRREMCTPCIEQATSLTGDPPYLAFLRLLDSDSMSLLDTTSEHIRLMLVQKFGLLKLAQGEETNNFDLVHNAVFMNGLQLQYASAELRNSKSIALAAVINNTDSIQYVGKEARNQLYATYIYCLRGETAQSLGSLTAPLL